MRLIDADKFEVYQYTLPSLDFEAGVLSVLEKLHAAPTVDAVPVRHGRWKCNKPCPICGEDRFKGLDADIWADWEPPYCPNCGAKMDDKEN